MKPRTQEDEGEGRRVSIFDRKIANMLSGKVDSSTKVSGKDNNKGKFRGLFATKQTKETIKQTLIRKSEKERGLPRVVLEQSHSR